MRIVVTGGTGFVGSEVVAQLGGRAEVERVTCLSRRPIAGAAAKVDVVLHQDFSAYDDALADMLAEHDGCIWALGGKASDSASEGEYERTTVTFTLRFAQAIAPRLTRPFRFDYLSGMGADPTESARLPWERTTRLLKGRVERQLEELTRAHPLLRATAFRPAGILERGTSRWAVALLAPIAVPVERLATAMIDEVTRAGSTSFRVVPNAAIRRHR